MQEHSIVTRNRKTASGFPLGTETTYESATRSYLMEGITYYSENVCAKPTIKYRVKNPTQDNPSTEQYGYYKSGNLMVKQVKSETGSDEGNFLTTSWYYDSPDMNLTQMCIIYYHYFQGKYSGNDIIHEKFFTPDGQERERYKNETITTSWQKIARMLSTVKYVESIPIASDSCDSE